LECERKSKFSGGNAYDRAEKSNSYYGGANDSGEFDSNRYDVGGGNAGTGEGGVGGSFNCGLDHSVIEQETRDLRLKVRRLETLLAEKEGEGKDPTGFGLRHQGSRRYPQSTDGHVSKEGGFE